MKKRVTRSICMFLCLLLVLPTVGLAAEPVPAELDAVQLEEQPVEEQPAEPEEVVAQDEAPEQPTRPEPDEQALENAAAAAERASDDLSYVPGEIVVVYNEGVSEPVAAACADEYDGTVAQVMQTPISNVVARVEIPLNSTVAEAIEVFGADANVAYAQPNFRYTRDEATLDAGPTDPLVSGTNQWHHEKIGTKQAWEIVDAVQGGKPVLVSMIDEAGDLSHEDLKGMVDVELSKNFLGGEPGAYPSTPATHGTHVLGLIGGLSNNGLGGAGVASGGKNQAVRMFALNVFESDGKTTTTDVIAAINYSVANKAQVINLSLGYLADTSVPATDKLYEDCIRAARDKGAVVVCSAGNNGTNATYYPSDFDSTISVINIQNYTDPKANPRYEGSNYGSQKNICAPGTRIAGCAPGNQYGMMTGTSAAAPIAAGVAAVIRYVNPTLTPQQVREVMVSTATDLYTPGHDDQTGAGMVNVYEAAKKAQAMPGGLPMQKTEPGKVSKLTATGVNTKSIKLTWTKATDASGYYIYRSTSSAGSYARIKTIVSDATLTYTDSAGTKAGTKYYYKICAFSGSNGNELTGPMTGPVAAQTKISVGKVSGLKASATNGKLALSWKKVSGATGYQVYRATSEKGKYKKVKTLSGVKMSLGSSVGRTYYYKVRAYKKSGATVTYGAYSTALAIKKG